MLRSVVSLVAGVVIGGMVGALGESLLPRVFPPGPGVDFSTPAGAAAAFAQAPALALWLVILIYAIGALVGGAVATRLAGGDSLLPAIAVGGILMLAGISNLVAFTRPLWMALATVVVFVPAAVAGGKLACR
jgi:hypothetical protein